jgi:hypothetical protein
MLKSQKLQVWLTDDIVEGVLLSAEHACTVL